jgi:hypothetical protein
MGDNRVSYGFRWSVGNPHPMPVPLEMLVASGQTFDTTYDLNVGDPVQMESTGMMDISEAGDPIWGIVVGIAPYWDGEVMKPDIKLPSGVTYGTLLERQTKIHVVPAHWGLWDIDVDDNSTADSLADYQALIGENCDHTTAHKIAATKKLNPRLDISTHGTSTAQWRIVRVSPTLDNRDFSGLYVKLTVQVVESQFPMFTATGV